MLRWHGLIGIGFAVLLHPLAARGQTLSSAAIVGVVKDSSDAVLPGVTVEAASPALIEKVRTITTDGQGQYKIVDLRPGSYTVTFTLAGFSTVVREGIELTTGFSAPVNAVLALGSVQERITVTGASPVIDTQTVRQQSVLSRSLLDTLPTAKSLSSFSALVVGASTSPITGVTQDVGGNQGEPVALLTIHGSRPFDQELLQDGMRFGEFAGAGGGIRMMAINQVSTAEVNMSTGSNSAEAKTGGVLINVIPKEGGNRFTFYALGNYTNKHLQGTNQSDELRARGLSFAPETRYIYDEGAGLGGPFVKDKVWFYTGHRWWGASEDVNTFFNATQGSPFYTPDLNRRAFIKNTFQDSSARVTWQAAAKDKFNFYFSKWNNCLCFNTVGVGNLAPEAGRRVESAGAIAQATWTHPVSNRLLLEAGTSYAYVPALQKPTVSSITPETIPITELSNGFTYNALGTCCTANYGGLFRSDPFGNRFTLSYITGSHAFKTGVYSEFGYYNAKANMNQDITYQFLNQVPNTLTQWATPIYEINKFLETAVYVQDQWTINKLTLNLGGRFQVAKGWVPAYVVPAGRFAPERQIPEQSNIPNWKDFSPRIGAAYDLFGNGKTAIKAFIGKYPVSHSQDIVSLNNVLNLQPNSATRTWNDTDVDFVPDCDLASPLANAECGASSINNFGSARAVRRYDHDTLNGYGVREYNWQGSVSVSHEVRPGWGVMVGFFRTSFGNLLTTDNLAVEASDYTHYCVTVPVDSRLPSEVRGSRICGQYDVALAKFGQTNQLVLNSSDLVKQTDVYKGVDVTFNGRFARGHLGGGLSVGRGVTDNCGLREVLPEIAAAGLSQEFCKANTVESLMDSFQLKLNGSYRLPWGGADLSATLQNLPGIPINATRSFTNAEIAPELGRNLAACGTRVPCTNTVSVRITRPGTLFEDRLTQVDFKMARPFQIGSKRLRPSLAIYNLLNGNTVLQVTTVLGPAYLVPRTILTPRIFKFELQLDL